MSVAVREAIEAHTDLMCNLLADNLLTHRQALEWSPTRACYALGTTRVTLDNWEQGKKQPFLRTLQGIARVYDTSLWALLPLCGRGGELGAKLYYFPHNVDYFVTEGGELVRRDLYHTFKGGTVGNWLQGKTLPTVVSFYTLAGVLDIEPLQLWLPPTVSNK